MESPSLRQARQAYEQRQANQQRHTLLHQDWRTEWLCRDAFVGLKVFLLYVRRIIVYPPDGIPTQRNHNRAGENDDARHAFHAIHSPVHTSLDLSIAYSGILQHIHICLQCLR